MITKAYIYNLALNAMLLTRQISNPETDASNEAKVLNNLWDVSFQTTLEDMDLNSTSTVVKLELVKECPYREWNFAYKYPSNCAFFRRIHSGFRTDTRNTHIPKNVVILDEQKVILTNQEKASAEIIIKDFPITSLSSPAAMTIAIRLAMNAAPLVTGKGAAKLMTQIQARYGISKAEAQSHDERENFSFEPDNVSSEFVEARLS